MPQSLWSPDIQRVFQQARSPRSVQVALDDGGMVDLTVPFASPPDWRDQWIYFLLVDRFSNPATAPRQAPWDGEHDRFQGGTFAGIRARLDYLKALGVGALWLSPVLKNCQFDAHAYHGYGIQDFVVVEPRFASDPARARVEPELAERELRDLIDQAHARGMYVIFDIVLNHTGDVFEYDGFGGIAPWRDAPPYPIRWRDALGAGRPEWSEAPAGPDISADAAVWPSDLRDNRFFRRRGNAFDRSTTAEQDRGGDFYSLKELVTDAWDTEERVFPVRNALIRAYQYVIAKYDVDGFRIDTLKYIEPDFAQVFGNACREFALSIGKRNFFTFGEVYDSEEKIAGFIGRNTAQDGDLVGVDAALDFPLFYQLPAVMKGMAPPSAVVAMYTNRRRVQRGIISSHGEASRYFVTFLDNHDQPRRFYFSGDDDPHRFDDQLFMGVACLFALQGIPCLYYGTEQGLHGAGGQPEAVREALWGKLNGFDQQSTHYRAMRRISAVRDAQPALRYGRQYFRPISGDGAHFGISQTPAGVLAFSRILNDQEVLVVANTSTASGWAGEVIVDAALNPKGATCAVVYSNKDNPTSPQPVADKPAGTVTIQEPDGGTTTGPARTVRVSLQPMEIQILSRP